MAGAALFGGALSGAAMAHGHRHARLVELHPAPRERPAKIPRAALMGFANDGDAAPVIRLDPGVPPPPVEVAAAPVALLEDAGTGRILYGKDADKRFLPASVTKTMTAFLAFELIASGRLRPDQVYRESMDAYRHWHNTGSRMFLEYDQPVTVDQLLMGIMNVSANDGCIVLAEGFAGSVPAWVAMMNAEAQKLGMTESHFNTPNGYMDNGQTWVSARDMGILARTMLTRYPAFYRRYVGHAELTFNGITQRNHDPVLGVVPGADGIKTGFTGEAHYNYLGSAQRGDRRLILVVAGVPTPREREKASKALLEWGFSAWSQRDLFSAGATVAQAQVQGGTAAHVPLVIRDRLAVLDPTGARAPLNMRVTYRGPLPAPIAKGTEVAELEVRQGNAAPWRVPLLAGANVPAGSALDRVRTGLARWLP